MNKTVYLDYSATTPQAPEVTEAISRWNREVFGNPSSQHSFGRAAKAQIEEARDHLADHTGFLPKEIAFTSGGTESNNWALVGTVRARGNKAAHIIVSAVEHPSLLKTAEYLQTVGYEVSYAQPTADGVVTAEEIARLIKKNTVLVSVMHVNNETGVINPVEEIGCLCRERGILFHCDAVQSFGKIGLKLNETGAGLITLSAHKIYGPKGCGALIIREGTALEPLLHGGGQEAGRRPGTENINGIVGFDAALTLLNAEEDYATVKKLQHYFERELSERFPFCRINGAAAARSPFISNVSFPGVDNESLLINLDLSGIAVSVGSACSSGSVRPSHVLQAMGLPAGLVNSAIRFSFGRHTTRDQLEYTLEKLKEILPRLQKKRS